MSSWYPESNLPPTPWGNVWSNRDPLELAAIYFAEHETKGGVTAMTANKWRAAANAGFVVAVLALGGFGLYQVAGRQWQVQPTFRVRVQFDTIAGLEVGHRVRLQGIDAGVVERVIAPAQPGQPVELVLRVDSRLKHLIRTDAVARIVAEGLVGAKVVELSPGRPDAPALGELDRIASERPTEVNELLKKAASSLARIDATTLAAEQGLGELAAIVGSIRRGEGSLGKLVRDETAYDNLLDLSRRGERALTDLDENLTALKETWPLSRYFDHRAYLDRDRVLYQPGAQRHSRAILADDLFERGRSVLTAVGQTRLDEIGRWCNQSTRATSEVVVAAFTDDNRDADLAEILTQEQAETVRKYLVQRHSIQSAGWFKSRKVAAVGFGAHLPRTLDLAPVQAPSRRVEIFVFTPQT
jgi:phospholipid/cholesterol/gamma-HCH transport system substrate-binding protein